MSHSSDHPMAEPPTNPPPAAMATTNGSVPNAKPKAIAHSPTATVTSTTAATTTTAAPAPPTTAAAPPTTTATAGATAGAASTALSAPTSSNVAAVLTADDIKYKRKYRDLKKRIREIEEENDQLNIKLSRARKNIRRLRVERSFLFEKLDNVDLPTPNHSLDHASSSSSSSGSDEASEAPSRRGSAKKKSVQPPAPIDSNTMAPGRKPKGRPPGRKSTGPTSRRRGATQEKEQQSKAEKAQRAQRQAQDEEEDQLDEEEYETQALKDAAAHDDDISAEPDLTRVNAMLIDQIGPYSDAESSQGPAVKQEEAMVVDSQELPPTTSADLPAKQADIPSTSSAQQQVESDKSLERLPEPVPQGPQGAASAPGKNAENDQVQSQSQGAPKLGSGQELLTTPVQVHPLSPRIGHLQAQPLRPPYQQPAWQHYDLPHRQLPDQQQRIQDPPPLPPPPLLPAQQGATNESTSTTPTMSATPVRVSHSPPPVRSPLPLRHSQPLDHQCRPIHHPISHQKMPHEVSQSHFQTSAQYQSQQAFRSQEVARRHSYEHTLHQHHQGTTWTPPSPSQQSPTETEYHDRNTPHRQSAPSVLQQPLHPRTHSWNYSAPPHQSPSQPLQRSPDHKSSQRPTIHPLQGGYRSHYQYDMPRPLHPYHQQEQQPLLHTVQQLRTQRKEQVPELPDPNPYIPKAPTSNYNRPQIVSSIIEPQSTRSTITNSRLSPSVSLESSPSTPRAPTPPILPPSPTQLRSPATTPTQPSQSALSSTQSMPGTPQHQQRRLSQQSASDVPNVRRFAHILPRAPMTGSMAPPPPPLVTTRKRKGSGPLSVETSPARTALPTPTSPGWLPTPGASPSSTSVESYPSMAAAPAPTITPFSLFSKQHYKLAAAQPGVCSPENISQTLQRMWSQLPEQHKAVYHTAVSQGDYSIASIMRTPQVGRPSSSGQSTSPSSAVPGTSGKIKAGSVDKKATCESNLADGEGREGAGSVPQERAAVMTRRHNNAFFQFSMQHRKRLTRELRLPSHRITQILGNMWKQLPPNQKLEFEKMAYKEQQKIMREQNDYFKKHGLGIKNYDTIVFALSAPPSDATPEKKDSVDPVEEKQVPTATATPEKLKEAPIVSSEPTTPSSPPGGGGEAFHNVHRPNNQWDRQTQSGKIVFTEPLTIGKPKEKKRMVSGGRPTAGRVTTSEGSVMFMPPYHQHDHPSMGPPPPAPGPSGRDKVGAVAHSISSAPNVKSTIGSPSGHSSMGLLMRMADGEEDTAGAMEERHHLRHGGQREEDMYEYGYAPSTPYYSGPCYIPPSPYPLEPSLLNDSGDEEEEGGYGYHDDDGYGQGGVGHEEEETVVDPLEQHPRMHLVDSQGSVKENHGPSDPKVVQQSMRALQQ